MQIFILIYIAKINASITPVISIPKKLPNNQQVVYDIILNNPGLRIPAISDLCQLKQDSVDNSIKKLKKRDLIEYIGKPKNGGYYVKNTKQRVL